MERNKNSKLKIWREALNRFKSIVNYVFKFYFGDQKKYRAKILTNGAPPIIPNFKAPKIPNFGISEFIKPLFILKWEK